MLESCPRSILKVAALLWLNLFVCNYAHAASEQFAKIGWWTISYRETNSLTGCQAAASFRDQTEVVLALLRDDDQKSWVVYLSNPQWVSWISRKKRHQLAFAAVNPTRIWRDAWYTTDSNELYLPAKIALVNSLADADSLAVLDGDGRLLAKLDMKDSEAAIKAVVNCLRQHSSSPPIAQNQPRTKTGSSSGSAFFVAPNVLVTNDHVVTECGNDIRVRYPNSEWHRATISGRDQTNDLALLHTDLESHAVASFRLQSRVGESVAVYGFPYAGLLSSSGNFTTGTLAALSGMNDDSRFVQTSAPVQPGNSGGPLLDMSGSVIGIVEGQLNALTMMKHADSVPQNVNFAVQAPIVVNFLASKGQGAKTDSSVSHDNIEATQVADLATKFTVQVYCEGSVETADASPPAPRRANLPATSQPSNEQRAKDFALSLQRLWSSSNVETLPALDGLYEDEVMYYGKRTTREAVLKEKRAFANRFPQREYRPRDPVSASCQDDICTVNGVVDFRAINPAAQTVSTGVATFEYQFVLSKAQLKIRMENGEVVSRDRAKLSPTNTTR